MKKIFLIILLLFVVAFNFPTNAVISIPRDTSIIENEAFMNDTNLDEIVLPEGIISIYSKAFANSSVSRIYLPNSLLYIADNAFDGCENVVGWGNANDSIIDFFNTHDNLTYEGSVEPTVDPNNGLIIGSQERGTTNYTYCSALVIYRLPF